MAIKVYYTVQLKIFVADNQNMVRKYKFDSEDEMIDFCDNILKEYEEKHIKYRMIVQKKEIISTLYLDYEAN